MPAYGSGPYGASPYGGGSNSGTLLGGGAFTATGVRVRIGSLVRLLGGGTFTATSVKTVNATAHFSGGGTFTATATRTITATSLLLTGGGTFSATGTGIPNGSADFSGGGTFTAVGETETFASGLLDGGGTFTVDIPELPDPYQPIVLPDVIAATVSWLNTAADVVALIGNRVGTQLPATAMWPAIRIDPTGGFAVYEYRLDQPNLQIQCFAPTDLQAVTVARTVRASLVAMAGYRVPNDLVVVDVVTSSPRLLDDEARTPPVAHATFNAQITVRPDP